MIIQNNTQLKPYNSFRTEAVAKLFSAPESIEELKELIDKFSNEKKLIIGNGFNLFFTKDFDGLVIRPSMKGISVINEDEYSIEIEAMASENWDDFVEYCVQNNYSGSENLSLIPGTVGSAPVQNIGAYGVEVEDIITKVSTIDINTGNFVEFSKEECQFGYRDSIFKRTQQYVITSVVFKLSKTFTYKEKYIDLSRELEKVSNPSLANVREAIIRIRTRKLPDYRQFPNAGSFFKNPILTKDQKEELQLRLVDAPIFNVGEDHFKTSAAFLIDNAGFKGKRKGMIGTYEHHSLIIVNYGTGNGGEIVDFMKDIQKSVFEKYAVDLEPEVWIF